MNGPVQVATDGACLGNPGPGGWAWTTGLTDASGGQRVTTNQEMELRAILEALRAHPDQVIVILTDSQYAIDCVTTWLPGWRRRGWRTSARRPVKHQPTIEAIAAEPARSRRGSSGAGGGAGGAAEHGHVPGENAPRPVAIAGGAQAAHVGGRGVLQRRPRPASALGPVRGGAHQLERGRVLRAAACRACRAVVVICSSAGTPLVCQRSSRRSTAGLPVGRRRTAVRTRSGGTAAGGILIIASHTAAAVSGTRSASSAAAANAGPAGCRISRLSNSSTNCPRSVGSSSFTRSSAARRTGSTSASTWRRSSWRRNGRRKATTPRNSLSREYVK